MRGSAPAPRSRVRRTLENPGSLGEPDEDLFIPFHFHTHRDAGERFLLFQFLGAFGPEGGEEGVLLRTLEFGGFISFNDRDDRLGSRIV